MPADLKAAPPVTDQEAHELGLEAYLYLYPLVIMEATRRHLTGRAGADAPATGPMGAFVHIRAFPPGDFRAVVRPNFDTLYSAAWLDLTTGPVIVSVPDTHGRYYLLPMLDMWTDVFAVPGSRTTGTEAQQFAVMPPGWHGDLPGQVLPIQAPTPYVWLIGRTQTNGPDDYAAVNEIQDGFGLHPLAGAGVSGQPAADIPQQSPPPDTDPLTLVTSMTATEFFTAGAELMRLHPPHVTDWSVLARMSRIGVRPAEPFDNSTLPEDVRAALEAVPEAAHTLLQASLQRVGVAVNGWTMLPDLGVYGNAYLKRAVIAMDGLGANPPEDAVYPVAMTDSDGAAFVGENAYQLHFNRDGLPPTSAFWSVTMYDSDGFTVPNSLERYALGDRDPLTYNADGSLDLYLQHEDPGDERDSNWLPAPRGPLGITLRIYAPRPEVLDGRWQPPAIRRIG
jgi:hypothetical protein